MSEFSESGHPLLPELFFNRDSFSHHLTKVHFHIGEDPLYIPRMRVWLGICHKAAGACRSLGLKILTDSGEFEIGKSPATQHSVEELFQSRKKQLSESERLLNSHEWPACHIVPGTLLHHEDIHLKYHTLTEHVGKSVEYLKDRLQRRPDIDFASSFSDRATAESAIAKVLALLSLHITGGLSQGKKKIQIPKWKTGIDVGFQVGIVVARDGRVSTTTRLKVVLVKDAANTLGFRIKTAYPDL